MLLPPPVTKTAIRGTPIASAAVRKLPKEKQFLQRVNMSMLPENGRAMVPTTGRYATAAVLSWIVAVSAGPFPAEIPEEAVWQTVYLAVFCTAIGYTLQNFGQITVSPTAAGVIVSTEAVFAVLVSMLFGEEHLSLQIAIGFAVIFLSLIVSETGLKFLKRKKAGENKSEQTIDDKDK